MSRKKRKSVDREIKASAAIYPKHELQELSQFDWPDIPIDPKLIKVWACRDFLVQAYSEPNGVIRLSVTRNCAGFGDRLFGDGITWDQLQWLKEKAGFGDSMAVEIYPQSDRVVNQANMRHLWILPEPLKLGWLQD